MSLIRMYYKCLISRLYRFYVICTCIISIYALYIDFRTNMNIIKFTFFLLAFV